jgi:hypothetical protein
MRDNQRMFFPLPVRAGAQRAFNLKSCFDWQLMHLPHVLVSVVVCYMQGRHHSYAAAACGHLKLLH